MQLGRGLLFVALVRLWPCCSAALPGEWARRRPRNRDASAALRLSSFGRETGRRPPFTSYVRRDQPRNTETKNTRSATTTTVLDARDTGVEAVKPTAHF